MDFLRLYMFFFVFVVYLRRFLAIFGPQGSSFITSRSKVLLAKGECPKGAR